MRPRSLAWLAAALILVLLPAAASSGVLLREEFESLERWRPLTFPKIPRHSTYDVVREGDLTLLRAESDASASGVVLREKFDIYDYPRIRWRWRAESVYERGDVNSKKGDDYPIRLYVIFQYDPAKASAGERFKFGAAKLIYGEYPPYRALNYIWANRAARGTVVPSAYAKESMMIVMRTGEDAGAWFEEEADILADFRRVFGEDPPREASLAFMNDSDDTGGSSRSLVDYIEVSGPAPPAARKQD